MTSIYIKISSLKKHKFLIINDLTHVLLKNIKRNYEYYKFIYHGSSERIDRTHYKT